MTKINQLSILSIFILTLFCLFVPRAHAQTNDSTTSPNQVIVQFHPEYSPFELESVVISSKKAQDTTIITTITSFIANMFGQSKVDKARTHLLTIQQADIDSGATEKYRMFPSDSGEAEHTYLIHLDGSVSVHDAVEIYEALDETVYAQPNYIYGVQEEI